MEIRFFGFNEFNNITVVFNDRGRKRLGFFTCGS